jgi:WD40 repeat protein
LALGSTDGYITIYNLTSKSRVKFKAHSTSVITLAIVVNKGKQYLASGGDLGCNSVILWDTVSWSMHMKLENHKGAVTAIADLRDNCSIVSGSYDKMINIYDLNNSGKVIFDLSVNNMAIAAIALNSTGSKMISSGLNNSLAVWQIIRNSNDAVQAMIL